jgi:hypothetical protein
LPDDAELLRGGSAGVADTDDGVPDAREGSIGTEPTHLDTAARTGS